MLSRCAFLKWSLLLVAAILRLDHNVLGLVPNISLLP